MRSLKLFLIVMTLFLCLSGNVFAQRGAMGRGGATAPLSYIVQAVPIYASDGTTIIGYIALNDTSGFHLENEIWLTADSSDGTLMHLFQVNSSGEFVTGEPLYMRKLALTPGANRVMVNMDTLDAQGASVAAGELSYYFAIADSELVEIYADYDGDGDISGAIININAALSVTDLDATGAFTASSMVSDATVKATTIIGNVAQQNVVLVLGATTFAVTSNVIQVTGDNPGANVIATITGAEVGIYTFIFVDGLVTITDTDAHDANTVDLSAAFTGADDTVLTLVFNGTSWYEVSRSTN